MLPYHLTDPRFPYVPADSTDIRKRFRAEGMQTREEQDLAERVAAAKRVVEKLGGQS